MLGSCLRRAVLTGVTALAVAGGAPATSTADEVLDIDGIYEVQGETLVEGQPDRFVITGKMVVRQNGGDCTTVVEVAMRRTAGASGPSSAALIGTGDMKLEGRKLVGAIDLQSLVSEVPELDVAAPYTPRTAGPVLEASAQGEVLEDGTLALEVRSTVVGEGFTLPEGRHTNVKATRVARKPTEPKRTGKP
jgi:hypothetical protein